MRFNNIYSLLKTRFSERQFGESFSFICIGVLSALVCSGYARLFTIAESTSSQFFSSHPLYLFGAAPLGMALSFLLVRWFAPGSSGSGIPQVMVCIEKDFQYLAKTLLRKTVIVIKILSSLVAVFIGAAIGREGPSLQVSASIAYAIGVVAEKFHVKIKTEQVLVAGAASGLAAAFNTPIGGIVYAIEELSKEHVRNFKDVLILAVVISGLTAQLILGNYLYLGYPVLKSASNFSSLLMIAGLSILCGVLGSVFSKFLLALISWRRRQSFTKQLMIVAGVGVVIAACFYLLGPHSLYSGKEVINQTLFSSEPMKPELAFSRFITPLLSSMTGIAGGVFAPSLSTGAAIGSYISNLINAELQTVFALAGMVGFLTGVTHTPITSFILVLEMTDRHSVVLPMMIAAVFSSFGAKLISKRSFYEEVFDEFVAAERDNREG